MIFIEKFFHKLNWRSTHIEMINNCNLLSFLQSDEQVEKESDQNPSNLTTSIVIKDIKNTDKRFRRSSEKTTKGSTLPGNAKRKTCLECGANLSSRHSPQACENNLKRQVAGKKDLKTIPPINNI